MNQELKTEQVQTEVSQVQKTDYVQPQLEHHGNYKAMIGLGAS